MPELTEVDPSRLNGNINPKGMSLNRQIYDSPTRPSGVEIVKTPVYKDENGGQFLELARFRNSAVSALEEKGTTLDLSNGQVNASILAPGTIRLGHLHPNQDELWMVALGVINVGLCDLRAESSTYGMKAKYTLSEGNGIYIPHGVVHSLRNNSTSIALLNYFTSIHFSAGEDSEELRAIPHDPEFWKFLEPECY